MRNAFSSAFHDYGAAFKRATRLLASDNDQKFRQDALLSQIHGATVYLSPETGRNFEPALPPDGRFVAFIRAGPGSDDLYVSPLAPTYRREPRPYPAKARC